VRTLEKMTVYRKVLSQRVGKGVAFQNSREMSTLILNNLLLQNALSEMYKFSNKYLIFWMMIMTVCLHLWISEKISEIVDTNLEEHSFMSQCRYSMPMMEVKLTSNSLLN